MAQLAQKKAFVRYISHEIRTPLNTAMMAILLLKRELKSLLDCPKKSKLDEITEDLRSSCETAVTVLDELLDYDKLQTGVMTLDVEPVFIKQFVTKIVNSFTMFAIAKGVSLQLEFRSGEGVDDIFQRYVLQADESKLSQVLRNLLSKCPQVHSV